MGVDLILLPIDHARDGWGFSHTVLGLDRATDLWDAISALPSEAPPVAFLSYVALDEEVRDRDGEPVHHYGQTARDAYDHTLRCATVAALLPLAVHPRVHDSPRNRAAWAYLEALPAGTRVALYWH